MSENTSRKQVIFNIKHYKNNAFFISQDVGVALTIVNVEYSEFMNLLQNENVLRTLTRSTFTHTQNIAVVAFHSAVRVWCMFLHNASQMLTRQRESIRRPKNMGRRRLRASDGFKTIENIGSDRSWPPLPPQGPPKFLPWLLGLSRDPPDASLEPSQSTPRALPKLRKRCPAVPVLPAPQ